MAFTDINNIINEKLNIVEVVSRYVKLERAGNRFRGLCPFHKEKSPSFFVNDDDQFFHCFGCSAHGNALSFIMRIESLQYKEAVAKIASDYGIRELADQQAPVDDGREELKNAIINVNKIAAVYFHESLLKNEAALSYLEKRNVGHEMIKRFAIGFAGDGDSLIRHLQEKGVPVSVLEKSGIAKVDAGGRIRSFFFNRIMVPIINQKKQVIGFGGRVWEGGEPKYLNTSETMVFNKKANLFGLNFLRDGLKETPYILLAEGYFDVIALHNAGFKTAVAALGTAITAEHLRMLGRYEVHTVLLLDGDAAGRKAMKRVTELEMPEKLDLRVAFIPFEGEDPDSLLRKENGRQIIKDLADKSLPVFQYYIDRLIKKYYLNTTNINEKEKIQKEINRLMSKLPPKQFKWYDDYIRKDSRARPKDDKIKIFWSGKKEEKDTEDENEGDLLLIPNKKNGAKEMLNKLLFIASRNEFLVPTLDRLRNTSIEMLDENGVIRLLLSAHDTGDSSFKNIAITLDAEDKYKEEYLNMSHEMMAKYFEKIISRLLLIDIDEKINNLNHDKSDEAKLERLRLSKVKFELRKAAEKVD